MFWLIVVILVVAFFCFVFRPQASSSSQKEDRSTSVYSEIKQLREYWIPSDAHDAVEAFARLADLLWRDLNAMGLPGDPYFSIIRIHIAYREGSAYAKADFSVDFDRSVLDRIIENHSYTLGDGFSFSGTELHYASESITGLDEWFGNSADEWKKLTNSSRDAYGGGVDATVVNNCPAAHVSSVRNFDTGRSVTFKFD